MIVKACIFDLGGTIVDRYSFTPLLCLQRAFKGQKINVPGSMIRKDMGLSKEDHIHKLLEEKHIQKHWLDKYRQKPTKEDRLGLFSDFKILQERETNAGKYTHYDLLNACTSHFWHKKQTVSDFDWNAYCVNALVGQKYRTKDYIENMTNGERPLDISTVPVTIPEA